MRICDRVYDAVAESGASGVTPLAIAEVSGIEVGSVRTSLDMMVRRGRIARHKAKADEWGNSAYLYMLPEHYREEWDEPLAKTEIIKAILEDGGTVDIYWNGMGKKGYGDNSVHSICVRLREEGYPVKRRKNGETGRWEYYFEEH